MPTNLTSETTKTNPFAEHPIAIEAGLQGKEYGHLPSELLGADRHLSVIEQFWLNSKIRAATAKHIEDNRKDGQSAGVATPQEKEELVEGQDQRAKNREQMQEAGVSTGSLEGQLDALEDNNQG